MHHPIVGDLDLDFEAMELSSAPGLVLTIYTAAPGGPSADALTVPAYVEWPNWCCARSRPTASRSAVATVDLKSFGTRPSKRVPFNAMCH